MQIHPNMIVIAQAGWSGQPWDNGHAVEEHTTLASRLAFGRAFLRAMARQQAMQRAAQIVRNYLEG